MENCIQINYFIFFKVILILCAQITDTYIPECEIGTEGKCLGDRRNNLASGYPNADASLIITVIDQSFESCKSLCIENVHCFMAAFNTDNNKCNMYRNISYQYSMLSDIKLYLWICCHPNTSFPVPHRCPGFWRHKPFSKSDNEIRSLDPLREFQALNEYHCQMGCLKNFICGAANYFAKDVVNDTTVNCQLIIAFPVESLQLIPDKSWETYQWQCEFNYSLPRPVQTCTYRLGHRLGYWVTQNTSMTIRNDIKYLIYFYTMDYLQCLRNCELYVECRVAWYSLKSNFCLLEAEKTSTCADLLEKNHYIFTTYIWNNCSSSNDNQILTQSNKMTCRTLTDNMFVYIYSVQCGHRPSKFSKPVPCWQKLNAPRGTVYSDILHCRANQSFRSFETINNTDVSWQKVFTGYETFWLVNVSDANFPISDENQCEVFDASKDVSNLEPLKIIKRTEWFSTKPKKPETPFPTYPVKYVIITDTERPFCNCFSVEACSSIIRHIQSTLDPKFIAIPYSFIVTGDGVAYEGRGFDLIPAVARAEYNHDSLAIALCGRYTKNPNTASLNSVKQLIQRAIKLKKVINNYTLYIYNDVMDEEYPYEGLRRVIELWPHYRGHIKSDCETLKMIPGVCNVLLILLVTVLLINMVHTCIHRICHTENCKQVQKCRIETIYCNRLDKSVEILPQIIMNNIKNLSSIDIYMSSYTSQCLWIEDYPDIFSPLSATCKCQMATFSTLDIYRLQSKLITVNQLACLPEIRNCSRKIAFIFQRNAELGKEYLLISHFIRENSLDKFIYSFHENCCLCNNFNLKVYKFNYFNTDFKLSERMSRSLKMTHHCRDNLEDKYRYAALPRNS